MSTSSTRGTRSLAVSLFLVLLSTLIPSQALANNDVTALADEPTAATPQVWVSKTTNLNPLGEEVTIIGRGFVPADGRNGRRPPLLNEFGGSFVVFGKFQDVWKPSLGAPSTNRKVSEQRWAVLPEHVSRIGGVAAGAVAINANGTFETTLTVRARFDGMPDTGNLGIFTFAGSGAIVPEFEIETPLSFTPSRAPLMAFASSPVQPQPDQAFTLSVLVNPANAEGSLSLRRPGLSTLSATIENGAASFSVPPVPGGRYVWDMAFTPVEPLLFSETTQGYALTIGETVLPEFTTQTSSGAGYFRWGVKSSFREYVTGPIAKGSIDLSGAGRAGSQFIFGQSQSVGALSEITSVNYAGAVRFLGHQGVLNVSLANPRVVITSPSSGLLSVEVGGTRTNIASLNLAGGSKSQTDTSLSYTNVPATLLSSGQSVFSFQGDSFYQAGATLDPVSFSVGGVAEEAPASFLFDSFTPEEPDFEIGAETQLAPAALPGECALADAMLTWGFKESFRSYISGTIAQGEWGVSDSATYETPAFSFPYRSGSIGVGLADSDIAFDGTVTFAGHDGVLTTRISNLRFVSQGEEKATVFLDIAGTTMDGVEVARTNVAFADIDLAAARIVTEGSTITISEAPATLSAEGSRAFGTYPAGEALDPLTVIIMPSLDCATTTTELPDAANPGVPWSMAALLGAGALGVGVGGTWLVGRFIRRQA